MPSWRKMQLNQAQALQAEIAGCHLLGKNIYKKGVQMMLLSEQPRPIIIAFLASVHPARTRISTPIVERGQQ